MKNIVIDSNQIRALSAGVMAQRFPVDMIRLTIFSLGYDPWEDVNEIKLCEQLKGIIDLPKPILEIGPRQVAGLSPNTIANRYTKDEIKQAIRDWGNEEPAFEHEPELAAQLGMIADKMVSVDRESETK
jgi:hypothetical protein